MQKLKRYWNSLRRRDKRLFLVFYENKTAPSQGFSDIFLNALSKFDGAICVVTLSNISLQSFSPIQPNLIADIVEWIKKN